MRWWWWYVCMYSVTLREAKSTFTRSDYVDCLRWENWNTTQQHTKESKCNVFLTLRASWTCVCSLWGCAGGVYWLCNWSRTGKSLQSPSSSLTFNVCVPVQTCSSCKLHFSTWTFHLRVHNEQTCWASAHLKLHVNVDIQGDYNIICRAFESDY